MPEPLPKRGDADLSHRSVAACQIEAREGRLLHRVRGQDGLRHLLKMIGLGAERAASSGSAAISFSAGSGTPMMPVEEGKTSSARQPKSSPRRRRWRARLASPAWPAAQLALPALMATTRTRPPVARRFSLSTISGAAITRLA